MIITIAE